MAVVMERVETVEKRLSNHSDRIDEATTISQEIKVDVARISAVFSFWKWMLPIAVAIGVALLKFVR